MQIRIAGHDLSPVLLDAKDKQGAIAELAGILAARHGLGPDCEAALREAALRREASLSTGMEKGVAVPHGVLVEGEDLRLAAGVLRDPVDWGTLDGSRVGLVVLFAVPEGRLREYQRALGELMGLLIEPETRRALARKAHEGRTT